MTTTALPRAASSPAAMAISLPKLREKDNAESADRGVKLPQGLQSLVARAVVDQDDLEERPSPAKTDASRAASGRRLRASLNTGTTTESSEIGWLESLMATFHHEFAAKCRGRNLSLSPEGGRTRLLHSHLSLVFSR